MNVTDCRQERERERERERVSGPVLLVWAQFSRSNVIVFIFTSSILSIWDIYTGNLGAILYKFSPCDNKIVIAGAGEAGTQEITNKVPSEIFISGIINKIQTTILNLALHC